MIKDMLTAQYSAVSYLVFTLITVAFSYRDKYVGEIRGRMAFSTIFFVICMYVLNKI